MCQAKTNIMMRRWNHNVILFWGISRFLSAVYRRWFHGQSGDQTCLVLCKRLVICFARPFQLLPSACTDIPLTLSWKFFPPPPQSPTCHRLHLLIVLSTLVCRKYLLICGGFLSPPFLKRCWLVNFIIGFNEKRHACGHLFQTVEILARVISSANQCATVRSSRSFS